ncbi:MAG: hypothetical protein DHS20C09_20050 [marine bacterium B5-7]|nr:MAG: hypothetical protein DHS20C09_20050 [marine bacterium B5-7]
MSNPPLKLIFLYTIFSLLFIQNCQRPSSVQTSTSVNFQPEAIPYQFLSDYAFFTTPLTQQQVNASVIAYEPRTALFTDYAHKARFVWMPDSVQASVADDGSILFPNNTVLIKSFYYPADFNKPEENRRMIETRLLIKKAEQWEAFTYLWNEEGTEAELNLIGDIQEVSWNDKAGIAHTVDYIVPNKNQCKSCHNRNNVLLPIGPKAQHLNGTFTYQSTKAHNQLQHWQEAGILEAGNWQNQFAPTPIWNDPQTGNLEARALAYLEINCGHCHHPEGPAHTTGLYLGKDFIDDRTKLGQCKPPVAAGKGSGGRKYSIVPGQPDSSILYYRMLSDDPGVMMPEIGRAIAHEEGLVLIKEWILEMNGACN